MSSCSSAVLCAPCKINLYLRVGKKLPNGYHELDTLFVPLKEPYDIIEIFSENRVLYHGKPVTGQQSHRIRVDFSVPDIDPERNTLTKAYAWYSASTGFSPSLSIRVRKNIPHGAGLGGGSSDAAALLLYLQREAAKAGHIPLDKAKLIEKSAAVGADVPFFILGTAAKAAGIGEKLIPVPTPYSGYTLVLACPDMAVSTVWAFAALDEARYNARPENSDNALCCDNMQKTEKKYPDALTLTDHQATYVSSHEPLPGNDFEEIVLTRRPPLARLHARLCDTGAEVVRMSGTGSSLFALFRNGRDAETIAEALVGDGCKVYMQVL
ncbi:MAG: 4-(cytidine 5'-diphospho)-2-C-methyl-D-erythritol kinase [Desulfovibrio sp.]|nr:4-(cytidine 5'-diphospho)-2-C-methyl-D-erythritol kinase [Desulfovibrio sp.]